MAEEIVLPEKTPEIIEDILKKHGLQEKEEGDFEKFFEDPEECQRASKESLSYKLAGLIGKCAEGEAPLEELPSLIEGELGVPKQKAQKIGKELKEKILEAGGPVSSPSPAKPKPPQKPDVYREAVG